MVIFRFAMPIPEENELLETILREGGSLGITFVLTANRVTDVFEKFRSNIPNAVSFELSDPSDYYYAVGRPSKAPSQLPPGRGLVKGQVPPLMFQAALPSSGADEGKRSSALRRTIAEIRQGWTGEEAPQIAPLPGRDQTQGSAHSDRIIWSGLGYIVCNGPCGITYG